MNKLTKYFQNWWTREIDYWSLACIFVITCFGYVLMLAASPAVAIRIGAPPHIFIIKQTGFLLAGWILMLSVALLPQRIILKLAFVGTVLGILATAYTLVHGMDIKGARRWISLPVMSIQPSEFLKPCFAVTTGWILSLCAPDASLKTQWKYWGLSISLFLIIACLLVLQPDIGMLSVIAGILAVEFFIDGISLAFCALMGAIAGFGFFLAYTFLPHVHSRVERFLHPHNGDHYQVDMSLRAIRNGGIWGMGPGEGEVKNLLPDAHADFIFAVAGEEFGLILCLIIIALFAILVIRTLLSLIKKNCKWEILASAGLVSGFGFQACVNMASTVNLIPTKGMTLPFISYGGSSILSVGLTLGMLLSLARRTIAVDAFSGHSSESKLP
ncbi:cell division protein FtsW [Acetobacteraceae bacterium]|nr:cell division protein FtsW [Acetobacteraceae bacterium]